MSTSLHRQWFGRPASTAIVLLHEGLGSVSAWGRFPEQLADTTGLPVLAYDRAGYGRSGPHPGPWPARFMHDEAAALPALLAAEGVSRPVLVGHSDGASIALLYSACAPAGSPPAVAVVSLSAHVLVEPICVSAIGELRAGYPENLRDALVRHHGENTDAVVDAWSDVWLSDRFRTWTIDDEVAATTCPVLAIQGVDDRYGTMAQLDRVVAAVSGPCRRVELDGVDHWPHREATESVLAEIADFTGSIRAEAAGR